MADVVIYSTTTCPYCTRAKDLLQAKGVSYTEYYVDKSSEARREMESRTERRTVPQIFIDGNLVGGFDDLRKLNETGMLDQMLKK